jgi:hypothetical protein
MSMISSAVCPAAFSGASTPEELEERAGMSGHVIFRQVVM